MKILVTGGAGFVGSNLCDRLLKKDHEVICLDSFFSGSRENVKDNLDKENFSLLKHDIRKRIPYLEVKDVDQIYHLACPASPIQYQFDPVLTLETSIEGTKNVLNLARKTDARVVYTSTSEVYGDPLEHPQKEDYFGNVNTLGKRACYDEGKRAAETLCKDFHKEYGVDVRIVRIFNTYGPRMRFNDGRVISNFVLQSLLDKDITVHGDGKQTRSFMYIDDLLNGLEKVMRADIHDGSYEPFNLGNPDEKSILSLAKKIKNRTDSGSKIKKIPIEKVPNREGDPKQRKPDISRAKNRLDWKPEVNFEKGLQKTIEDFKDRLSDKDHILVFVPTYMSEKGPAESALEEMIEQLSEWEFDIVTARMDEDLPREEHREGVNIYRLGGGSKLDKYLLPIKGAFFAKKLHKKHSYKVNWAIMASYGALSSVLFSLLTWFKIPTLLSVYEGSTLKEAIEDKPWRSWIYKLIFRNSSQWQVIGDMTSQQKAWLDDDEKVQAVQIDDKELLAKRTKEALQELEILSSHIN